MAARTMEAIEDWVLSLTAEDLNEDLHTLELRSDGSRLARALRLQNWLLGSYMSTDFEEISEVGDMQIRARRVHLRSTFVDSILQNFSNTLEIATGGAGDHPFTILNADPAVQANLIQALGKPTPEQQQQMDDRDRQTDAEQEAQHQADLQNLERQGDENGVRENANEQQTSGSGSTDAENINLTTTTGQNFQLPTELATLLVQLKKDMDDMKKQMSEWRPQYQQMSSTRVDNGRRSVNFASTFPPPIAESLANSTLDHSRLTETSRGTTPAQQAQFSPRPNPPTPQQQQPQQQQPQQQQPPQQQPPSQRQPTLNSNPSSRRNQTTLQTSGWNGNSRDLGAVVRKWNIKFSGENDQSIDHFLTKIEDCSISANLSEEELFHSLSELFKGTAAIWYRNERDDWPDYDAFVKAARQWYGRSSGFEVRLQAEANARTQGLTESTKDYITHLKGVMMKMSPRPAVDKMLDLLYRNMLPTIKERIRRSEFSTIEQLVDRSKAVEEAIQEAKTYRPPPAPECSLLPELAYRPPTNKEKEEKPAIAAAGFQRQKQEAPELIATLTKTLVETLEKFKCSGHQPQGATKKQPQSPKKNRSRKNSEDSNQDKPEKSDKNKSGESSSKKKYTQGRKKEIDFTKPLKCTKCGELGFSFRTCPNCKDSGNDPRGG